MSYAASQKESRFGCRPKAHEGSGAYRATTRASATSIRAGSFLRWKFRLICDLTTATLHHQRHERRECFAVLAPVEEVCSSSGGQRPQDTPGTIIPYRGSWVGSSTDNKRTAAVRIDRKRTCVGHCVPRALGLKTMQEMLRAFYKCQRHINKDQEGFWMEVFPRGT